MNSTTGAIFLPCRGGGTDTTYYTADHDVDEDLRTTARLGGMWLAANVAGIAYRAMNYTPATVLDYVASSNMKKSLTIRMVLMSTKI